MKTKFKSILGFVLLFYNISTGQSLTSLGGGVTTNGIIYSMEYDTASDKLYVAGFFKAINGVLADNLAVWDGNNWTPLISNMDGTIFSMKIIGNDLYIGGYFQHVNGITANNVAKWDGTSWSGVGGGVNFFISSMEAWQNKLYATGSLPYTNTNFIQTWDGNTWTNVGTPNYRPAGLLACDSDIVAYGGFNTMNGDSTNPIASFNGTTWNYFPAPIANYNITKVLFLHDSLHILCGNSIFKWDGLAWDSISSTSLYNYIENIFSYHDSLFIIDDTTTIAGDEYTLIRKCDRSGPGEIIGQMNLNYVYNDMINCILNKGDTLLIGGSFDRINNQTALSLLQYDGSDWTNPGKPSGLSYINAWQNTDVWNDYLDTTTNEWYIGGEFYFAGHQFASNIAKWNGITWQGVGEGFNESVYRILKFNNELYAVGLFTMSGGTPINRIAKWNGTQWIAIGTGANGSIYDALVWNNELYVGGKFTMINGISANHIAKFNGSTWSAVGNNILDEDVKRLTTHNGQLIAGSNSLFSFNFPDLSAIAILNAGQWSIMDPNLSIYGSGSFCHYNNDFFFASYDGGDYYIYKWNGTNWLFFDSIAAVGVKFASFFEMNNELYLGTLNHGLYKFDGINFNHVSDIRPFISRQYNGETLMAGFIPDFYAGGLTRIKINNVAKIDFTLPQISISANTDTVCAHQYVYFDTQTNDPFISLEWHVPGGTPNIAPNPDPIIHYLNPGTFPAYVIATNMVGTDTFYLPHDITVITCYASAGEIAEETSLKVFPNPVSDKLYIHSDSEISEALIEDINGRVIRQWKGRISYLDIAELPPGIYLLTLISDDTVFKRKILKQ